ncbi:MAG: DUF4129 domain-containing protein [Galbitalea sp.]
MIASQLRADAPVTPNGATAQAWLLRELAKPEYRASQPTWFDRFATWVQSLFAGSIAHVSGVPGLGILVLIVVVAVVIVIALLVFGVPRLNRRSAVSGELFGADDRRTAAQILAAARSAAARGDFSLAIIEGLRSIARSLDERTLVTMFPGTTAHDFAARAGTLFPDFADGLAATAAGFDRVRYLGGAGGPDEWRETERLAVALTNARPAAALPTSGPPTSLIDA